MELNLDDLLVIYTDGVTEAMSPAEEEFGEERLKEFLRASAHLDAECIRSTARKTPRLDGGRAAA